MEEFLVFPSASGTGSENIAGGSRGYYRKEEPSMTFEAKYFEELTTTELYEILKTRSEIFVVEQNCVYQDLDDKDYESLHVFSKEGKRINAYLRVFYKEEHVAQIGRVVTLHHGTGFGGQLLREGIRQVREKFLVHQIHIEAQCYAVGYYEKVGFEPCSEEFMLDGIPHVEMILTL